MFRIFTRLAFSSPKGARNKTCNNPNNLNSNPPHEFLEICLKAVSAFTQRVFLTICRGLQVQKEPVMCVLRRLLMDGRAVLAELPPGRGGGGDGWRVGT